jgi:ATP-binding cassette subfamily C protein CydC
MTWLIRLARPIAGWMALAAALTLLTIASGIGLMATSAYLLSAAALHPSIAELQIAIVGVRLFGLTRGLFRYLERLVTHQATFRLLGRLRVEVYRRVEPLAPARLDAFRRGDLLARLVADVETLQEFYARVLAPPAAAMAVSLMLGVALGRIEAGLGLLWLGFVALAGLALPLLTYVLARRPARLQVLRRAKLQLATLDLIHGLPDLSLFGARDRHLEHLSHRSTALARAQSSMAAIGAAHSGLGGFLVSLAAAAFLAAATPLVADGTIAGVHLAVLILAVMAAFEALGPLPLAAQHLNGSSTAAMRLLEVMQATPSVVDPVVPDDLPSGSDLVFENVSFAYDLQRPPALRELTFSLPAGGSMAILGASGSGKSTIVHLLQRFWEYDQGRILLGGAELRRLPAEAVRARMAVLPQRVELFAGTLAENLRLAAPQATEAEVWRVLATVRLADRVSEWPDQLDTWIGEQGQRLSGGERQRLALARTLLRPAPLLVLDEPTAQVDSPVESELMRAILQAASGRSLLLMAHHLHGLDAIDEILIMQHGSIIERGAHADLLRREGPYARMWARHRQSMALEGWRT